MTDKTPGFYIKYVICDEHDNSIVHSKPVRVLTAREFYAQRCIPAHVANTYESFAIFMSNASTAVNLLDSLTAFSRSNYKISYIEQAELEAQMAATADFFNAVKKVIEGL